jgi:hypothetical protein
MSETSANKLIPDRSQPKKALRLTHLIFYLLEFMIGSFSFIAFLSKIFHPFSFFCLVLMGISLCTWSLCGWFFSQHLQLLLEQLGQYFGLLLEQLGQQHLGCFVRTAGQQHLDCF